MFGCVLQLAGQISFPKCGHSFQFTKLEAGLESQICCSGGGAASMKVVGTVQHRGWLIIACGPAAVRTCFCLSTWEYGMFIAVLEIEVPSEVLVFIFSVPWLSLETP